MICKPHILIFIYLFYVDYERKIIGKLSFQTVIKSISRFKKSVIRVSVSSIDWFPRRKIESYLGKIKKLQVLDPKCKMFPYSLVILF
jgi:hypothetical protein